MTGPSGRWRITHRTPATIADTIERSRRLDAISQAIDADLDLSGKAVEARDYGRADYHDRVRGLLTSMVTHVPATDAERRQALDALTASADETRQWQGADRATLYTHWDQTRQDLDHDIADIAGVELLLGMVETRDYLIADLDNQVCQLKQQLHERDRRITDLDDQLAHLEQDHTAPVDQIDHTPAPDHREPGAGSATPPTLPVPVITRPVMPQIGGLDR
ncbi:hypothetical protein [Nocardia terpenica]|uniref:Uncharacterized protein n=1 Tax=Nocardia terpenica TaxID=455432 RepID=A0A6G9Z1V6_9NOCA|nr:hypothetical protein [Nocardia terpenica]QIS19575.1 hypothetical protein F6W96_16065 [Nocardia terpenica]